MGILKTRKNKKFSYSPRYYDDKGEGSPYQINSKFDKYRKATGDQKGLITRFKTAWEELQASSDQKANRRILIITLILLFIFLYIIDFDLSIFYTN